VLVLQIELTKQTCLLYKKRWCGVLHRALRGAAEGVGGAGCTMVESLVL
jgi:hypothetical protein